MTICGLNQFSLAVAEDEGLLDAHGVDELGGVVGEVVEVVGIGAGTLAVAAMIGRPDVAVGEEFFDEPGVVDGHGGGAGWRDGG